MSFKSSDSKRWRSRLQLQLGSKHCRLCLHPAALTEHTAHLLLRCYAAGRLLAGLWRASALCGHTACEPLTLRRCDASLSLSVPCWSRQPQLRVPLVGPAASGPRGFVLFPPLGRLIVQGSASLQPCRFPPHPLSYGRHWPCTLHTAPFPLSSLSFPSKNSGRSLCFPWTM